MYHIPQSWLRVSQKLRGSKCQGSRMKATEQNSFRQLRETTNYGLSTKSGLGLQLKGDSKEWLIFYFFFPVEFEFLPMQHHSC